MPYYKVSFNGTLVTDCILLSKKQSPYEYSLVLQYKRYVHFDEQIKPAAMLCKASSHIEAKEIGLNYLSKLSPSI